MWQPRQVVVRPRAEASAMAEIDSYLQEVLQRRGSTCTSSLAILRGSASTAT